VHQSLAIVTLLAIWRHLRFAPTFARLTPTVAAAVFVAMLAAQSAYLLYQNKAMGAGLS
jgi:cytochrome c oxidase subunit IV